jgi:hypothetical protein
MYLCSNSVQHCHALPLHASRSAPSLSPSLHSSPRLSSCSTRLGQQEDDSLQSYRTTAPAEAHTVNRTGLALRMRLTRPPLPSSASSASSSSSIFSTASSVALSSPATSAGLSPHPPFFSSLASTAEEHDAPVSLMASPVLFAPLTGKPLVPLPSSSPIHSFPAFILGLVHSVEADPATIAHHLSNLAASHAAPATFSAIPEGKPTETDQIVDALVRIAARLKKKERAAAQEDQEQLAVEQPAQERDDEEIAPYVGGSTVEEVRKTCQEQIKALKLLHAEELHRSQVSHDEEVRWVAARARPSEGCVR